MIFKISQISHLEHAFKAEKVTHLNIPSFFVISAPQNLKISVHLCVFRAFAISGLARPETLLEPMEYWSFFDPSSGAIGRKSIFGYILKQER